jgi:hypothetical protein
MGNTKVERRIRMTDADAMVVGEDKCQHCFVADVVVVADAIVVTMLLLLLLNSLLSEINFYYSSFAFVFYLLEFYQYSLISLLSFFYVYFGIHFCSLFLL